MSLLSSRSSRTHWNPSRNLPQSRVETTIGAALECGNSQHADPKFTMVNISDIWRSNPTTLSQLRIDRIRSITSNPICHPLPSQSDGESPFHHPWLLAVRCWEFAWKIDQDYSHRLHPGVASELRSCSSSELPPGLCDSARTPEIMNLAQLGVGQSIVLEIWRFNWQKVCQHFDLMCLSPFFFDEQFWNHQHRSGFIDAWPCSLPLRTPVWLHACVPTSDAVGGEPYGDPCATRFCAG